VTNQSSYWIDARSNDKFFNQTNLPIATDLGVDHGPVLQGSELSWPTCPDNSSHCSNLFDGVDKESPIMKHTVQAVHLRKVDSQTLEMQTLEIFAAAGMTLLR
jgi:hypothetical protein